MPTEDRLDRIESQVSNLVDRINQLEKRQLASDSIGSTEQQQDSSRDFTTTEASESTIDPQLPADLQRSAPKAAAHAADEATPTVPSAAALFSGARASPPPLPPTARDHDASSEVASPQEDDHTPSLLAKAGSRQGGLEQLIGGRVMALVGGVIVVIAAAFFAKLAYDKGWIGNIPAGLRAAALTAFGAAILGVGELALRRYGRAAAVGLFIAGLGTLYVDAWSAGPVLGILSPLGSLVAMAVVMVIGILLTARSGSVSIGVVSIAAGAAAPYLAGGDGSPATLGIYLTSLLVIAFAAASIRPRPFLQLRVPAFGILLVAALPWMFLSIDGGEITVLLIIGSGWWLLVHAQALHTATRGLASKWNAGLGFASTAVFAIAMPLAVRAAGGGGVAWNTLEGWIPLGLAALSIVTIFQAGTGLDAIRPFEDRSPLRKRERAVDLMSLVLWVETAVLLFVAAGLLLEGPAIPVAWCGLGLAAAYLAHRLRSRGVAVCSLIIAILGQFAATVVVFMNGGNRNVDPWFAGTGWQWTPVSEQWLALLALVVVGRRSSVAGSIHVFGRSNAGGPLGGALDGRIALRSLHDVLRVRRIAPVDRGRGDSGARRPRRATRSW